MNSLFLENNLKEQVEKLKPKSVIPTYYKKDIKGWATCTRESFDKRIKR